MTSHLIYDLRYLADWLYFVSTSPCTLCMFWHSPRYVHPSNICWTVLTTKLTPFPTTSFSLNSQIFLSKLFSRNLRKHHSLMLTEQMYQHENWNIQMKFTKKEKIIIIHPIWNSKRCLSSLPLAGVNKTSRCLTFSIDILLKHVFHLIWFSNIKGQFSIIVNSSNIGTMFNQVPENLMYVNRMASGNSVTVCDTFTLG